MAKTLSSLPVGAKIVDPNTKYYGAPIVWTIMEHDHDGTGSTSLVTDQVIALKCFDAKEPLSSNSSFQKNGNSDYKLSNLFQWLNSSAAAGLWYTAQHSADQGPSAAYTDDNPYNSEAGFLNGFSKEFLNIILFGTHKLVKSTGAVEYFGSRIYLLSAIELGLSSYTDKTPPPQDGSRYALFENPAFRTATLTPEAGLFHEFG